eukprot:TRINITY_DN16202_c0_g1_i3.p1 TRINITY_DN16202_c0_g1~~TRINITY_DN16202_c0_g1_i3.p1  ORF type:complete len:1279 (-),score=334.61 TRINITY_DN16202_c0_g1_i3:63-3899(-)
MRFGRVQKQPKGGHGRRSNPAPSQAPRLMGQMPSLSKAAAAGHLSAKGSVARHLPPYALAPPPPPKGRQHNKRHAMQVGKQLHAPAPKLTQAKQPQRPKAPVDDRPFDEILVELQTIRYDQISELLDGNQKLHLELDVLKAEFAIAGLSAESGGIQPILPSPAAALPSAPPPKRQAAQPSTDLAPPPMATSASVGATAKAVSKAASSKTAAMATTSKAPAPATSTKAPPAPATSAKSAALAAQAAGANSKAGQMFMPVSSKSAGPPPPPVEDAALSLPEPSLQPAVPEPSLQPAVPELSVQPAVPEPSLQPAVPEPSLQPAVPELSLQPAVPEPSLQPEASSTPAAPSDAQNEVPQRSQDLPPPQEGTVTEVPAVGETAAPAQDDGDAGKPAEGQPSQGTTPCVAQDAAVASVADAAVDAGVVGKEEPATACEPSAAEAVPVVAASSALSAQLKAEGASGAQNGKDSGAPLKRRRLVTKHPNAVLFAYLPEEAAPFVGLGPAQSSTAQLTNSSGSTSDVVGGVGEAGSLPRGGLTPKGLPHPNFQTKTASAMPAKRPPSPLLGGFARRVRRRLIGKQAEAGGGSVQAGVGVGLQDVGDFLGGGDQLLGMSKARPPDMQLQFQQQEMFSWQDSGFAADMSMMPSDGFLPDFGTMDSAPSKTVFSGKTVEELIASLLISHNVEVASLKRDNSKLLDQVNDLKRNIIDAERLVRMKNVVAMESQTDGKGERIVIEGDFPLFLNQEWRSTVDCWNRRRDKDRIDRRLGVPERGDATTEFSDSKAADVIVAIGYNRLLFGDHGPYVELLPSQVIWASFPRVIRKNRTAYYDEHYTATDNVKAYEQRRTVKNKPNPPGGEWSAHNNRREGYADYRIGMVYMSADNVIVLGKGLAAEGWPPPPGFKPPRPMPTHEEPPYIEEIEVEHPDDTFEEHLQVLPPPPVQRGPPSDDEPDEDSSWEEPEPPLEGADCGECREPLEWSDCPDGPTGGGWVCNNAIACGGTSASCGLWRWFCKRCMTSCCETCQFLKNQEAEQRPKGSLRPGRQVDSDSEERDGPEDRKAEVTTEAPAGEVEAPASSLSAEGEVQGEAQAAAEAASATLESAGEGQHLEQVKPEATENGAAAEAASGEVSSANLQADEVRPELAEAQLAVESALEKQADAECKEEKVDDQAKSEQAEPAVAEEKEEAKEEAVAPLAEAVQPAAEPEPAPAPQAAAVAKPAAAGVQVWAVKVNALAAGDAELMLKCRDFIRRRVLRANSEGNLHTADWHAEPVPTVEEVQEEA